MAYRLLIRLALSFRKGQAKKKKKKKNLCYTLIYLSLDVFPIAKTKVTRTHTENQRIFGLKLYTSRYLATGGEKKSKTS